MRGLLWLLAVLFCLPVAGAGGATGPGSSQGWSDQGPTAVGGEIFAGQRLIDLLEQLRRQGERLVFSSALVPGDYVVVREPPPGRPIDRLAAVLADLGLALERSPGSPAAAPSWLIVRAPAVRSLRGLVLSGTRRRPVVGARVVLESAAPDGARIETGTRADGSFELSGLDSRLYTVSVEAVGFSSRQITPVRAGDDASILTVVLHPLPRYAAEIVVTPGEHSLVSDGPGPSFRLDREQVVVAPSYGGDVTRVIGSVPGVAGPDNAAALNIRGGEAGDVAFVLDGLELYQPYHLADFQSPFSFIDSNRVQSIDVLAGGFPAEFGDRHGGFISVDTLQPGSAPESRLRLGTLNSGVSYATPLRRGELSLSARGWYPDALRESTELGDNELDPRFADAYLRYATHLSPSTYLSSHLLYAADSIEAFEADGNEQVRSDNRSVYAWVRAWTRWSDSVFSETVFSAGELRRSRSGVSEPEDDLILVQDDRRVRFYGVRHDIRWKIGPLQLLKGGLEVRPLDARYRYTSDLDGTPRSFGLAPDGSAISAYVSHRASLSPQLALELGVRWDDQTFAGESQWSPRLNGVWRRGRSEVRVAWGHYYQSQRIYELPLADGQTRFFGPERSVQADVSFRHAWNGGLQFRVDLYRRSITDVQPRYENVFNPLELFPETESDRSLIAPESARASGAEFSLRGPTDGPLTWWASYAWSRARDRIDGVDVPRRWDQPHTFKLALARRAGSWSLALTGTAHSGWPTVPASVGSVDGAPVLELGPRNSIRLPTYVRFDGKIGYVTRIRGTELRFDLEVLNIADRDNACCVDEPELGVDAAGNPVVMSEIYPWLGITPSFAITIGF